MPPGLQMLARVSYVITRLPLMDLPDWSVGVCVINTISCFTAFAARIELSYLLGSNKAVMPHLVAAPLALRAVGTVFV